jgi:hypothetical protein
LFGANVPPVNGAGSSKGTHAEILEGAFEFAIRRVEAGGAKDLSPIAIPPTYAVKVLASGTRPPLAFTTLRGAFNTEDVPVPDGSATLLITPTRSDVKNVRVVAIRLFAIYNDASTFFGVTSIITGAAAALRLKYSV